MQFKKLLIENNTENNFCVFNSSQFKRDHGKKRKLDHRKNIQINMVHVVHYSHS